MAASHGITHEIMHRLAVGSDASSRYSDRICSPKSAKPRFVAIFRHVRRAVGALFLDIYSICGVPETGREYLYDLFFELLLLLLVSPCVSEQNSPQNSEGDSASLACNRSQPAKSLTI